MTRIALTVSTAVAIVFLTGHLASAATEAALAGKVTSVEEGAMEGVVVSARKAGSTIRISVVTDAQGRYVFPAAKLDSGSYVITIRAAGYELDGSGVGNVVAEMTSTVDLKLKKTQNFAAQLTNADWMSSLPDA